MDFSITYDRKPNFPIIKNATPKSLKVVTGFSNFMNHNDLKNLREALIGELQAINQYQQYINETDNEKIKKVLSHIRDDEKEHFAELVKLIQELDPTQKEKFQKEEL